MIKLEFLKKEDLSKIIEWNENKSADDLIQWAGPIYKYPLTLQQVENYFLYEVQKDNSNITVYKILSTETDEMIGTVELRITDVENNVGRVCRFLIGQEGMRGKGIGKRVLEEIVRIGFEDIGLEKITLAVFDHNHSAIKCYENIGFIKTHLKEKVRASSTGYWNSYEMEISKG